MSRNRGGGGGGPKKPRVNLVLQGSPTSGTKNPRKEFDITVIFQIDGEGQNVDLHLFLGVASHVLKNTFRDTNNNPIVIEVKNGVGRKDKLDFTAYPHHSKLAVFYQLGRDTAQSDIDLPAMPIELPPGAKAEKPKLKRLKAFYKGQELSTGAVPYWGLRSQYTVRFQTFGADTKQNAEPMIAICEDGAFTAADENGNVLATNVTSYAFTTANTPVKGMSILTFSFAGSQRTFSFVHTETGETITATFHTK